MAHVKFAQFSWTGLYKDTNPADDEEYITVVKSSDTVKALRIRLHNLRSWESLPDLARKRLRRAGPAADAQFEVWQKSSNPKFTIREKAWIAFLWFLAVFLTVTPDISAGLMRERAYNVRSIGTKIRTGIQLIVFARFRYSTARLFWKLQRERIAGPLVITVAYALTAFLPGARHLYGETWYLVTAILLNLLFQATIQFYGDVRTWSERRSMRKEVLSDPSTQALVQQDLNDIERGMKSYVALRLRTTPKEVWRFHLLSMSSKPKAAKKYHLSRLLTMQDSTLRNDLKEAVDSLKDCLPKTTEVSVEPQWPKSLVLFLTIGIAVVCTFAFVGQWLLFSQTLIWAVVTILMLIIMVFKSYETLERVLDFFSNMIAPNVSPIFYVAIPRLCLETIFDDIRVFAALTVVGILINLIFQDQIGPQFLNLCKLCGIYKEKQAGQIEPANEELASIPRERQRARASV